MVCLTPIKMGQSNEKTTKTKQNKTMQYNTQQTKNPTSNNTLNTCETLTTSTPEVLPKKDRSRKVWQPASPTVTSVIRQGNNTNPC